ncbi:glycosyltransferase family 2 protein [Photobacterium leiognathi]|uniref:glycosyltransferase family 2 protein n=1 Tax=Photobacterium leiognathi TaxID=553611 RepID=UPI00273921FF|nr:glycosyltransferase family 2 protein [Photobacterium leiognathi]
MSKYSVSVIIPCYNSSKTIKRAIDSALLQSHSIGEVICIDDCSTDSTVDIIYENYSNNIKVKVIKNPKNRGVSYSRNQGVRHSSGDIIAFLDSDDSWDVNKIKQQLDVMVKYNADLVTCLVSNISEKGKDNGDKKTKVITKISLLISNSLKNTSTVILKKDAFLYFNENMRYSEDYDLWLRMINKRKKLVLINKVLLYTYKLPYGDEGLSSNLLEMEIGELKSIYNNASIPFFVVFYTIFNIKVF